jgi:hypothetical protein
MAESTQNTEPAVPLGNSGKSYRQPPKGLGDAMMAHAKGATPDQAPPEPPGPPASKPVVTPTPPTSPAAATPPTSAPAAPQPKPEAPPKSGPAQLRQALDKRDSELEAAKKRLAELEEAGTASSRQLAEAHTKIASAEERFANAAKRVEELEPLPTRIKEMEQRLQEREERLRIADYTATQEWHDKYVQPIAQTQQDARALMTELIVSDGDGNQRAATEADFNQVLSAPSLSEAARRARALFGDEVYQSVVNLRTRMVQLHRAQAKAQENAALESAEHLKRQQISGIQERDQVVNSIHAKVEALFEKDPAIFKPAETDAEAVSALSEGRKFADLLLNGSPEMTKDTMIENIAKGRAAIIADPVKTKLIARQAQQIKALEEELKNYRGSEPTVETRPTPSSVPQSSDVRSRVSAALDAHLASRR